MDQGVSPDMMEQIQQIQQARDIDQLDQVVKDMKQLGDSVRMKLTNMMKNLQDLKQTVESEGIVGMHFDTYFVSLQNYRKLLDQSESGLKKVQECSAAVENARPYLQANQQELEKMIPRGKLSQQTMMLLEELRNTNQQINKMLEQREKKITDLMSLANDDMKVRSELTKNSNADEQGVFVRGFAPVASKIHELELGMQAQDGYINNLQLKYGEYNTAQKSDPILMQRKSILEVISNGVEGVKNGKQYASEGTQFFRKLNEMVETLQKQVNEDYEKAVKGHCSVPAFQEQSRVAPSQFSPQNQLQSLPSNYQQQQYPPSNYQQQQYPPSNYQQQQYPPSNYQQQQYPSTYYQPPQYQPLYHSPQSSTAQRKSCPYCSSLNKASATTCEVCGKYLYHVFSIYLICG